MYNFCVCVFTPNQARQHQAGTQQRRAGQHDAVVLPGYQANDVRGHQPDETDDAGGGRHRAHCQRGDEHHVALAVIR